MEKSNSNTAQDVRLCLATKLLKLARVQLVGINTNGVEDIKDNVEHSIILLERYIASL